MPRLVGGLHCNKDQKNEQICSLLHVKIKVTKIHPIVAHKNTHISKPLKVTFKFKVAREFFKIELEKLLAVYFLNCPNKIVSSHYDNCPPC